MQLPVQSMSVAWPHSSQQAAISRFRYESIQPDLGLYGYPLSRRIAHAGGGSFQIRCRVDFMLGNRWATFACQRTSWQLIGGMEPLSRLILCKKVRFACDGMLRTCVIGLLRLGCWRCNSDSWNPAVRAGRFQACLISCVANSLGEVWAPSVFHRNECYSGL